MSDLRINHLLEVPDLIPEVAQWIFQAFWAHKGHEDSRFLEAKLREAVSIDDIPISLVAFFGERPVGTINLIENDDETRTNLKPWLAALWVNPEFRKLGVGT